MDEAIEKIKNEKDVFSKAKLIRYLLREKNYRVIDLAKTLSITPAYICHLNRLNTLPVIIIDGYYSKLISISILFVISRIKDEKKLIEIYEKILGENLTVSQTEDLIREELYQIKNKGNYLKATEKVAMLNKINKKFPNLKTKISQTRTKTKILLEIPGNLLESSKTTKEIVSALTTGED